MPTENSSASSALSVAVLFELALLGLSLLLGWLLDSWPLHALRLQWTALVYGALLALPPAAFFMALLRFAPGPVRQIRQRLDHTLRELLGHCSIVDLAIISLLAGVAEEFLFRGFLQNWLTSQLGWIPALTIASLIFGLLHWITPLYALFAAAMSLLLGWSMYWCNSLLAPIALHSLYDFLALIYFVRVLPRLD
ncbi:MAG: CPBP family intramembrane metalloprotease [Leptospirales bacterium]|nr:CPBP family intramembrane metalloprotease [Leptospirales bacterium]